MPIDIGSIIQPYLPLRMLFDITSAMIPLGELEEVFVGLPTDDSTMHMMNFVGIFTSYNLP